MAADVMSEDWDNLVILDACRYDIFEEENTIAGTLESKVSRGAHSSEFIKGNFAGRELHDTVYVTANPNSTKLNKDNFYTIVHAIDEWDPEFQTVRPEDMVQLTLQAHEDYPNKRIIAHFMQPHCPYLGETAQEIEEIARENGYSTRVSDGFDASSDDTPFHNKSSFEMFNEGVISRQTLRTAYRETLRIAIDQVKVLLDGFDGKSVVTADHGEYLGDRPFPYVERKVGHPREYTRQLRVVPWLTVGGDERGTVVSQEPMGFEEPDA